MIVINTDTLSHLRSKYGDGRGMKLEANEMASHKDRRSRGTMMAVITLLCVTPDPLLTRFMEGNFHSPPTPKFAGAIAVLAWKCLGIGGFSLCAALGVRCDVRKALDGVRGGPLHVLIASCFQAAVQLGFTLSFLLTDPATALLLVNLNPLFTALFGWAFLGETMPCRTVIALVLACASLSIVFLPDLIRSAGDGAELAPHDDGSSTSTIGNMIAVATGLGIAGYLTTVRHAATHRPSANMSNAAGLGALIAGIMAVGASIVFDSPLLVGTTPAFWQFAWLDAVLVAGAYVSMNLALRDITGTELALIVLLQVLSGPICIYLGLGILPTKWTMLGGASLLAVLAGHELVQQAPSSPPSPPPSPPVREETTLLAPHELRSDDVPTTPSATELMILDREADVALEDAIKSKAAQGPAPLPQWMPTCFVVVTVLASFCIGLIFGWGPFAAILLEEGVGSGSCAPDDTASPCDAQILLYALFYSLASCTLSFGGLPAGIIIDTYGQATGALVAGGAIALGSLLLATLPAKAPPIVFAAPFMSMGFGGVTTALTAFKSGAIFPEHTGTLITTVNVVFDISATVPLLAYELYKSIGVPRGQIFAPYALYVVLLFVAWSMLWRRYEGWLRASGLSEGRGRGDQAGKAAAGTTLAEDGGAAPSSAEPVAKDAITPLDVPGLSVREVIASKQFAVGTAWFTAHQTRCNLYLGVAADILRSMGDDDGRYMEILTATLAAAVVFIPLIAWATDKLSMAGSMNAVTALAVVHAACALVPSLPFQVVTFVVFTLLRAATFSVGSIYVARTFGFAKMGTVYGLMQCVGGTLNMILPAITSTVLTHFDGNWGPVFWALLLACAVQFALISWLVRSLAA